MKKIVAIALAAGLMTGIGAVAVYANHPGQDGKRWERKIERLKTELGLTAEQEAKIREVFEKQKAKIQAIREETRKTVASLLTAEQRRKFEERKQRHRKSKE